MLAVEFLSFCCNKFSSSAILNAAEIEIEVSSLHEIQKVQHGFIWGDNETRRHIHAVKWEVVAKPKSLGGGAWAENS